MQKKNFSGKDWGSPGAFAISRNHADGDIAAGILLYRIQYRWNFSKRKLHRHGKEWVREHPTFGVNVGRAVADRYPPFDAPAYVEQRIFEGFPSRADGSLMEAFHASPWSERQGIVSRLQDDRLRELGERLIYLESPDVLQEGIRRRYDDWRNARIHAGPDVPWTTIGSAVEELTDLATSGDSGEGSLLQDIERHLTELSNSR